MNTLSNFLSMFFYLFYSLNVSKLSPPQKAMSKYNTKRVFLWNPVLYNCAYLWRFRSSMKIIYFFGSKAFFFSPAWGGLDPFCGLLFIWKYVGLKWKRVLNAILGCSLKNDRMISSFPRQTIQYHSNPSLCPDQ